MPLFQIKHADPHQSPAYDDSAGIYALATTYAASLLFAVGIMGPCLTIYPKFGGGLSDSAASLLNPNALKSQTVSVVGGIVHLFQVGDWFIGVLLLLFSLIFPAGKLGTTFWLLHADPQQAKRHLALLSHLGKWSMLDVFVVAGIVVSFKTFPLGTRIEPRWGIYTFAASVICSMTAALFLKRHLAAASHS